MYEWLQIVKPCRVLCITWIIYACVCDYIYSMLWINGANMEVWINMFEY